MSAGIKASCCAAFVLLGMAAMTAMARAGHTAPTCFDIQPQPLAAALLAYAEQSGVELIAVGDLSAQKAPIGLHGCYAAEEALQRLLQASGLEYRRQDDGMIVISAGPSVPSADARRPQPHASAPPLPTRQLAEVSVMARLHEEAMIDVPIAMTAMTGEQIARLGLADVADVVRMTPGVSSVDFGGGFTHLQIRGVSASLGGNANGYYLDGVPFTGVTVPWYPDVRSWDIDRVEVLKGPQGTTFGAGSLGGTVRIITRKPDFNVFEAAASLSAEHASGGSTGWGIKTMANVALIEDRLALRLVATDETLAGWIDDARSGDKNINENSIQTARVKLRYAPVERLNINLSWWKYWLHAGQGYNLASQDMDVRAYSRVSNPWSVTSAVVTLDRDGSRWFYSWAQADLGRSTRGMLNPTTRYATDTRIGVRTQELRWSSTGEHWLDWTFGYYRRQASRDDDTAVGGVEPAAATQINRGQALYGEVIIDLPDPRWSVTAGLRYFIDEVDAHSLNDHEMVSLDATFSHWSPRLGLAWQPSATSLVYASISTGFRSGQLQPVTAYVLAEQQGLNLPVKIEPDSIVTQELGAKLQWLDGQLLLRGDVFFSRWRNVAVRVPVNDTFNGLVNSEGTRNWGVELSAAWSPGPMLSLRLGGSFISAEYVADVPNTPWQEGAQVYNVPRVTLDGSASWQHPLADGLDLAVRGVLLYNSARTTALTTRASGDAITTLNARVGVEARNGWSIYLVGTNLTDDDGALAAGRNGALAYRQPPRSIGIEVDWRY